MPVNKLNIDKIKQFAERLKGHYATFWVPDVGVNLIRILPPIHDDIFFYEVKIHFLPNEFPVQCLGPDCPVCQEAARLADSTEIADVERSKRLAAKTRYLMYIIDLKEPENGPQIFAAPRGVLGSIVNYIADPEWGDITDLENGYDVTIDRTGSGITTRYDVRLKKTPTKAPIDEAVLNSLPPLSNAIPKLSAEELRAKLNVSSTTSQVPTAELQTNVPSYIEDLSKLVK